MKYTNDLIRDNPPKIHVFCDDMNNNEIEIPVEGLSDTSDSSSDDEDTSNSDLITSEDVTEKSDSSEIFDFFNDDDDDDDDDMFSDIILDMDEEVSDPTNSADPPNSMAANINQLPMENIRELSDSSDSTFDFLSSSEDEDDDDLLLGLLRELKRQMEDELCSHATRSHNEI